MDLGLRGRAAFVAASSRGLGRAIAEQFCREGADVGLCARDATALVETAAALAAIGTQVVATPADVTDVAAVSDALDATADTLGRLDVLVVNAGGPPAGTFASLDDAAWQSAFELTLLSAVQLIRHALPLLRHSDAASIVVVSSTSVEQPIGGLLLSNSLRRAVSGLVASLATELAPHVRINSVLPGRIRTDRTLSLASANVGADGDIDGWLRKSATGIPLRRYGEPGELANAAVFLASPAASYISGQELAIDGGALRAAR